MRNRIYDDRGRFVARADLRIDGTRRIQEYDGADHRKAEVHRSDLSRERSLLRAGWERSGFTKVDLLDGAAVIIGDVDRLFGRPYEQRRLDAWNHLVLESLHGRRGRARALKRWFGPPPPKLVTDDANPTQNPVADDQLVGAEDSARQRRGVAVPVQGLEHPGGDLLDGAEAVHRHEQVAGGVEVKQR
jgi:hypothetical protein